MADMKLDVDGRVESVCVDEDELQHIVLAYAMAEKLMDLESSLEAKKLVDEILSGGYKPDMPEYKSALHYNKKQLIKTGATLKQILKEI